MRAFGPCGRPRPKPACALTPIRRLRPTARSLLWSACWPRARRSNCWSSRSRTTISTGWPRWRGAARFRSSPTRAAAPRRTRCAWPQTPVQGFNLQNQQERHSRRAGHHRHRPRRRQETDARLHAGNPPQHRRFARARLRHRRVRLPRPRLPTCSSTKTATIPTSLRSAQA